MGGTVAPSDVRGIPDGAPRASRNADSDRGAQLCLRQERTLRRRPALPPCVHALCMAKYYSSLHPRSSVTAVSKYFFTPVYRPQGAMEVVRWWEQRRPVYNLAVGTAGLMSLGSLKLFAMLPPHPASFDFPWPVIPVYALLANGAYTLGPLIDLWLRRNRSDRYAVVGPAMLRYGFVFSVGLTLLPAVLGAMSWGVRLLLLLR